PATLPVALHYCHSCSFAKMIFKSEDGPIVIPDPLGAKSGLTKNHVRKNAKYGGGHVVLLEGLHQLHCLVSLNSAPEGPGEEHFYGNLRHGICLRIFEHKKRISSAKVFT